VENSGPRRNQERGLYAKPEARPRATRDYGLDR